MQPKARTIRYDNVRSAAAEEQIIAQALREPALLDLTGQLTADQFSVDLFGRVFGQLYRRHRNGLEVGLGVLGDLSEEEMSHVAGLYQRQQGPVNETAFRDCIKTVLQQQDKKVTGDDDLLAFRNKLKESKGTNQ